MCIVFKTLSVHTIRMDKKIPGCLDNILNIIYNTTRITSRARRIMF